MEVSPNPSRIDQDLHYTQSTLWIFFMTFNIAYFSSYVLTWAIIWLVSAIILSKECLRQDRREELWPHEKINFTTVFHLWGNVA